MANRLPLLPRSLAEALGIGPDAPRDVRRAAANRVGGEAKAEYQHIEYAQRRARFPRGTSTAVIRGHAPGRTLPVLLKGSDDVHAMVLNQRDLRKVGDWWRATRGLTGNEIEHAKAIAELKALGTITVKDQRTGQRVQLEDNPDRILAALQRRPRLYAAWIRRGGGSPTPAELRRALRDEALEDTDLEDLSEEELEELLDDMLIEVEE